MYFDVPKVVRSPECDHGHDEESLNGRDMKIDILDDYIRTPEWFGGYRIYTGVPGGYHNPPGGYWASWAQVVEEERRPRGSHARVPSQVRIGLGRGRRPPFSFSLFFLPSPLLLQHGKGGVLLPVGVGLLMGRAKGGRPLPLLHSFIYGEGGTP